MAAPTVFDTFVLDLGKAVHNFATHTLKIYLTNNTPNKATHATVADLPGLTTGGGYTSGGVSVGTLTWSQTGGLASLAAALDAVFTATSGFGPFRYAVLYNDTSPSDSLICYWDNGSSISTAAGQVETVDLATTILNNFGFS